MRQVVAITNDVEHGRALARLELLFGSARDSDDGRESRELAKAIRAYERLRYPFDLPDAVDAVEFELDREVATLDGLVEIFGSRSGLADFMTRRRRLDADEMEALHERYGIELGTLSRPYRVGEGWYPILEGHLAWRRELKESVLEAVGV